MDPRRIRHAAEGVPSMTPGLIDDGRCLLDVPCPAPASSAPPPTRARRHGRKHRAGHTPRTIKRAHMAVGENLGMKSTLAPAYSAQYSALMMPCVWCSGRACRIRSSGRHCQASTRHATWAKTLLHSHQTERCAGCRRATQPGNTAVQLRRAVSLFAEQWPGSSMHGWCDPAPAPPPPTHTRHPRPPAAPRRPRTRSTCACAGRPWAGPSCRWCK